MQYFIAFKGDKLRLVYVKGSGWDLNRLVVMWLLIDESNYFSTNHFQEGEMPPLKRSLGYCVNLGPKHE